MSDTSYGQKMFTLIEAWLASGQSQKVWCAEQGLTIHRFQYWYRRYKAGRLAESPLAVPAFVPLLLPGSTARPIAELHYPDGRRLLFYSGIDAAFLKTLLT